MCFDAVLPLLCASSAHRGRARRQGLASRKPPRGTEGANGPARAGLTEIGRAQVGVAGGTGAPTGAFADRDRVGVQPAGRRGRGAHHPPDSGRPTDPRARNERVRRNPALGGQPDS